MTFHPGEEIRNSTDRVLVRAQQGDKEAFGMIFEEHHRFIYKFIYAIQGDHSSAEELTQETFLGAYRTIGSLRNEATLRTWLCAIAKNLIYTSFRQKRKEIHKSHIELDCLVLQDDSTPRPDAHFLNNELSNVIFLALDKLTTDKRIVFVLREFQGMNYTEISEVTGKTIPKLKTDLFRAKIEMQTILRPYLEVKK